MMLDKKEQKNLYHYCSIETFISIIKSGNLRFSDLMQSNDSEEIFLLFKQYMKHLRAKHVEYSNLTIELFDSEIKKVFSQETCFGVCLSEKKDLLSQWRGYAPNGGVCIGFNKNKLDNWCKKITVLGVSPVLEKIIYIGKKSKNVKELFDNLNGDFIVNGFKKLLKETPKYKNKGFEEEKEWRLFFYSFFSDNQELPRVHLNQGNSDIQISQQNRWYDLPFPLDSIEEIIVGPKVFLSDGAIKYLIKESCEVLFKRIENKQIKFTKTKLSYR